MFLSQALFQSAPAIAGGRILARRLCCSSDDVSIRARHCWRANPPAAKCSPWRCACFNPRPPLLAGESGQHRGIACSVQCFNPRPPLLAGESCRCTVRPSLCGRFNPRPPLLAGESLVVPVIAVAQQSFNPRPPLLAGESKPGLQNRQEHRSFNPRPPLLAGESWRRQTANQPV